MNRRLRRQLVERLTTDAGRIAGQFAVRFRSIEAEHGNVRRRYGICFDDGSIRIRLTHTVTGKPLKYSSLVNTLCHELAHLQHFDHGARFQALYARMLEWARREGIYRPARARGTEGKALPSGNARVTWTAAILVRAGTEVRAGAGVEDGEGIDIGRQESPRQLDLFG